MSSPTSAKFRFEKLDVWQDARLLNRRIYEITRGFPVDERFGLTSQVRRAAVSIAANIAEGSGRNSDRDFAHFLELAYGSAMELASHLYLARDVGLVTEKDGRELMDMIGKVTGRLAGLNRSLKIAGSKVQL
ncbi:MAG TPA: four helix bundle protein [Lacunisphaera sp.]|nr:four helix bundle protein [Lacunisphaera sp.]